MSTYLEPNHYPDDFQVLVVSPGNKDTAVFVNDREVVMTIDSIRLLDGALATTAGNTVFKVGSAAGPTVATFGLLVSATPSGLVKCQQELKPGESLFADVNVTTTQAQFQIRLRSRVA